MKIPIFANGTEFMFFLETNCNNCVKAGEVNTDSECFLVGRMMDASCGDGKVTQSTARLLGFTVEKGKKKNPGVIPQCTKFKRK